MTVNTTLPAHAPRNRIPTRFSLTLPREQRRNTRRATQHWLDCAHLLLEAREIAKRGQWSDFLRRAVFLNARREGCLALPEPE